MKPLAERQAERLRHKAEEDEARINAGRKPPIIKSEDEDGDEDDEDARGKRGKKSSVNAGGDNKAGGNGGGSPFPAP